MPKDSKKLKPESFGITYKVSVKLDKKSRLKPRARKAIEGYIAELLEPEARQILAGHGDSKIELGTDNCQVKDWSILDLVPEPPPQEELPGTGAEE